MAPDPQAWERTFPNSVPALMAAIESMAGFLSPHAANASIAIVALAAAGIGWLLFRTRAGYELRAVGLQPDAAENAGVNVRVMWRNAFKSTAP